MLTDRVVQTTKTALAKKTKSTKLAQKTKTATKKAKETQKKSLWWFWKN